MADKPFTTVEAFDQLLNRPDLWRKTGRPMQQLFSYRNKLKKGFNISRDTKEKILVEAGFTQMKDTIWGFPR